MTSASGETVEVDKLYVTAASVMYDALYVPGGAESVRTLIGHGDARHFVNEMYRHCKPVAAIAEGVDLFMACELAGADLTKDVDAELGVIAARETGDVADTFIGMMKQHRFWTRSMKDTVPA